jgi:alkaline phosphatase
VTWSTGGHTDRPVPVYGWGPGAEGVESVKDNTDIHGLVLAGLGLAQDAATGAK